MAARWIVPSVATGGAIGGALLATLVLSGGQEAQAILRPISVRETKAIRSVGEARTP